jgi:hypothetical protein
MSTVITIICILGVWIVFSAILVTIICMNSSRLSRVDNLLPPKYDRYGDVPEPHNHDGGDYL